MASARVEDEIAAPIDAVWACFADFGDLRAWAPGTPSVRVEGSGVGAVRFVSNEGQPEIRERLAAYDAAAHTFTYEMLDSPFQFTDYVATVRLHALDPQRTRIEWSSTFTPKDAPEEQVVGLVDAIYRMFIGKLKTTLAGA
jgi:uncharacterized protein YndB with AHSA1/START domain